MQVRVKLGSTLRQKAPEFEGGEGDVDLVGPGPAQVKDVMAALGISEDEVNLIYRNHVLVTPGATVHDGDRVGLFPPLFIHFSQFYLTRHED
jgi:hypothetical protein